MHCIPFEASSQGCIRRLPIPAVLRPLAPKAKMGGDQIRTRERRGNLYKSDPRSKLDGTNLLARRGRDNFLDTWQKVVGNNLLDGSG